MNIYGIFGAGGYGREVMPLARLQLKNLNPATYQLFFVVDEPTQSVINDVAVLSLSEFSNMNANQKFITCAIADSKVRSAILDKTEKQGIKDWSVISSTAVIMDDVAMGDGSVLSPFVTITSNVRIGRSFHANIYSYVAHDCVVGDYVTFAPGVKCNGNVVIGDHAYLGTGVIIRPGNTDKPLRIGEGAIIGMGAVVTKDVLAGTTVIGNPAKVKVMAA